jgi:peptidoglycan/xylan/chitin deacetylase (PgdA/CDA1 family)
MTWDDLRGILDRGHRVGSHTMTHRRLTALSATELERELAGSRQELEGRLGGRCADLSFPYGRAGDRRADLKDLSRRAGYRSCFSAIRGGNHPGDDPYEIRRDALDPSWPLMQVKFFLSQR